MMPSEFQEIKDRYDRMCKLVEEDPRAGSHACAIAYSIDVPMLIAWIERLNPQPEAREALSQ